MTPSRYQKIVYREFIDHIALDRRAAAEVEQGSFAEFTYGVPEDQHPSDHCPVSVRLGRPASL